MEMLGDMIQPCIGVMQVGENNRVAPCLYVLLSCTHDISMDSSILLPHQWLGKHFGITTAGKWWGTLDPLRLKNYFANNSKEYDRIMREDWVSDEFGDRRQELVFIGTKIVEKDIRETLDSCLCTDEEMNNYRRQLGNFLDTTFTVSADGRSGGPSLFDMGGVDHVE
jgi:hypothetical protein